MADTGTSSKDEVTDLRSDHEVISMRQSRSIRSQSIDISMQSKSQAEQNVLSKSAPFYKFVLTGGPCGGKTTALARLSSYLRERGYQVMTAPEAFTILVSNGFSMSYFSIDGMSNSVQSTVMDLQQTLEDSFERILRARGKPAVLLCDRGLMDGSAYMKAEDWDAFLKERDISSAELREGRYNAIFHLVTAAEGAERFYSLENNSARTETAEEARTLDAQTRNAWIGHPKLFVIDNSTDFEGKLRKLVSTTAQLVGLPSTSKGVTVKYLLTSEPQLSSFPKDIKRHIFEVEKVYLYDIGKDDPKGNDDSESTSANSNYKEEYSFARKRSHISSDGRILGISYGLTTVSITHEGKQIEVKRIITAREYNAAYRNRDTSRHIVIQRRISFLWEMQSFNVIVYKEPVDKLCLVHVQQSSLEGEDHNGINTAVDMPDFLQVERILEGDKEYGAHHISLIKN